MGFWEMIMEWIKNLFSNSPENQQRRLENNQAKLERKRRMIEDRRGEMEEEQNKAKFKLTESDNKEKKLNADKKRLDEEFKSATPERRVKIEEELLEINEKLKLTISQKLTYEEQIKTIAKSIEQIDKELKSVDDDIGETSNRIQGIGRYSSYGGLSIYDPETNVRNRIKGERDNYYKQKGIEETVYEVEDKEKRKLSALNREQEILNTELKGTFGPKLQVLEEERTEQERIEETANKEAEEAVKKRKVA